MYFFYENNAVFYFKGLDALKLHERKNIENSIIVDKNNSLLILFIRDLPMAQSQYLQVQIMTSKSWLIISGILQ